MSTRYQLIVLQKGLIVALCALNWVGLWSFRFVGSKRQIKYSRIKAFYSMFVLCAGLCAYVSIGQTAFLRDENIFFGSFTLKLVLMIYAYTILTSFAGAYLEQHWFAKEVELTYIKCMDVVDAMRNFTWDIDLSFHIFEIILKTIVFDFIHGVATFDNLRNSSDLVKTKPYLGCILIMPQVMVRLHINIFYGALVAINVYTTKLNDYLLHIVSRVASMAGQDSVKRKWLIMDSYCYLSDEIDKLSALYLKLVEATKSLNSIFAVALISWNLTTVLILTVQSLYHFVSIIELMEENREYTKMIHFLGILSIFLSTVDLLSTSNACQRIVNSTQQTADILHRSTNISRDVDIRFRRSIDHFSIQLLLNKLQITEGGMFTLDMKTTTLVDVFSMQMLMNKLQITECGMLTLDLRATTLVISAIVSYSVVLLQFELSERKVHLEEKT